MLGIVKQTYLYKWRMNLGRLILLNIDEAQITHNNASAASKGSTVLWNKHKHIKFVVFHSKYTLMFC